MNPQNIIIYEFEELFNILIEIKEILKFNLISLKNLNKDSEFDENKYGNFLILSKKNKNIKEIFPKINESRIIEIEK